MMKKSTTTLATAFAIGITQASSHMIMIEPHPFGLNSAPLVQVSPLGAGLPFPCQNAHPTTENITTVTAGSTTLVKFQGSAVHGGGSCQFSVAYADEPPSDVSQWKTIYSIIGGCPAEAQGNIQSLGADPVGRVIGPECGNDSGTECVRQFNVPVPKQMKNGKAIFAWTWFNKIGNREMYMNCAPIEIVGGSDDAAFIDGLPPIFQANIPGQCTTGNGILGFPDPGQFGKMNDQITPGSEGNCKPPSEPKFENSSGGDSSQPPVSNTQMPSTVASDAPSSTAAAISSNMPSQATSMATSVIVSSTQQAVPTQAAPATGSIAPDAPVSTDRPSWAVDMVACSTPGAVICISEKQFGICNAGWALPQDVAAGTACQNGSIVMAPR